MELSKRLFRIASMASKSVIADIGCDHALVCIEALKQGTVLKAYACDLREGPLRQAKINIEKAGLSSKIEARLQNGLERLPEDVEQVLIAGMGGSLMEEILEKNPPKDHVVSMILSPHKDAPHLRIWLQEHGWKIDGERIVKDGHFYPILTVSRAERPERLSDEDILFGVSLKADEDALAYLEWQKGIWINRLEKMPQKKQGDLVRQIALLETKKARISAEISGFKNSGK